MTISATQTRQTYTGNGSTTSFSSSFKFLADADVKVYVDGTLKTIVTDYTLSGAGVDAGGTVAFVTAPASSTTVLFVRDTSPTQETDYVTGDAFPAETHETALDKLTITDQEIIIKLGRTVGFADTVTDAGTMTITADAATRANKKIGFDASGDLVLIT